MSTLREVGAGAGWGALVALVLLTFAYRRQARVIRFLREWSAGRSQVRLAHRVRPQAAQPPAMLSGLPTRRGFALALAVFVAGATIAAVALAGGGAQPASPRTDAVRARAHRTPVAVWNTTGRTGLGAAVARKLQNRGFRVIEVTNATPQRSSSTVLFAPNSARSAAAVKARLGISHTLPLGSQRRGRTRQAALVVLIGADQAG